MKVGVENKKELMVMAVLLAVAIPLLLYNFRDQIFGSASAANVPLPAIASSASKGPAAIGARDNDPRLRTDILEASRKVKYEAGGRNIFRMEMPKIDPVKVAVRQNREFIVPAPPTPTPTPTPPPIPIIYYGYASHPGEPKRIFLQKKDEPGIFVAAQGDIVARRYRVVQIQPTTVTMEDVITNNRQPIPLTSK
ncbi:MAG TPA: hypothetical protein VKW06_20320 [Candidatus Angelobacter sp.]|nr:hypothetical protein [Candidatus Angelobacter sp.]